jgi:cytochrome P450
MDRLMAGDEIDKTIVTPVRSPGFLALLLGNAALQTGAARLGARFAKKPIKLGKKVFAIRHAHVCDMLVRDEEFGIAAVNETKINEVNGGPFILAMDRSAVHERERRALYEALAAVDMGKLRAGIEAEIAERLAAIPPGGEIDVVGGYARPVAAHNAQRLFGITGSNDTMFMEAVRSVFGHTFLNIKNDKAIRERAIKAGRYMGGWFAKEIARRRKSGKLGDDMMGHLLKQKVLDDEGARRTLGGMLVGSIDTTATCVAKIVTMLGRDPDLAARVRRDLDDIPAMYGWCNEVLRRWPHNPVVLRKASRAATLGGRDIPAGADVIAWIHAAMYDEQVFPDATRLRPDRDGRAYLHLGGGIHPCSGRPVNAFQIPLLVVGLLRRDLVRVGRIGWAGPFPHRLPAVLGGGRA